MKAFPLKRATPAGWQGQSLQHMRCKGKGRGMRSWSSPDSAFSLHMDRDASFRLQCLTLSWDKPQEVDMGGRGQTGTSALCLQWWQMQPGIVRELRTVLRSAAGAQVEGKA